MLAREDTNLPLAVVIVEPALRSPPVSLAKVINETQPAFGGSHYRISHIAEFILHQLSHSSVRFVCRHDRTSIYDSNGRRADRAW